jgi:hypothetical protein
MFWYLFLERGEEKTRFFKAEIRSARDQMKEHKSDLFLSIFLLFSSSSSLFEFPVIIRE